MSGDEDNWVMLKEVDVANAAIDVSSKVFDRLRAYLASVSEQDLKAIRGDVDQIVLTGMENLLDGVQ